MCARFLGKVSIVHDGMVKISRQMPHLGCSVQNPSFAGTVNTPLSEEGMGF
jgi:hypothetical protein